MLDNASSEIELLRASIEGNTTAFETIVKRYQSFACAVTFSATSDLEQSEELAHEAFIKAWANLAQLEDLTKFRAWFCTITRNIIRDHFRHKQRDIVSQAKPIDKMEDISSERFKPVDTIIDKEQQAVIRQALEQIPEKYREPLVLFYRQDQSTKKVAEQLELSEVAVKTQISRGRKMLKQQVAAMVETTISRTGPSKAFTTAVIASIAGIAIKGSGVAAAAGIAAGTSTAGTSTGIATIMSGITAKIITAAAVVVIGVGAIVTYRHITAPKPGSDLLQAGMVVGEQGEEQVLNKGLENDGDASFTKTSTEIGESEHKQADLNAGVSSATQDKAMVESVDDPPDEVGNKTGISGIVIDKSSLEPIKGAKVFYGPRGNPSGSSFTDVTGHFEFLDIKPQNQRRFYIVAKDFTSRQITLDIVQDKVYEDFKIELTAGSKVAGIAYDQNGKTIKGASVGTFQFTNHPVVTDVNGTFEIDGLDPAWGQYSLHVTHPNYPAFSTRFSPANAGETAWIDIVLKPGVTVYGQVTDSEGNPVANVSVGNTTSRAMWNCISAKTDSGGKYELKNVDAGELVLWAVINKHAPYVERFTLDSSEAKKLINIQLKEPLPLHGKIVDKQGNPLSGVSIGIREYKGVGNLADWQNRIISDIEGKFVIPNAPSTGTVILSVWSEQIPNTHPEIEVGQEEEYVIEVDRSGRIYGKVIVDNGGKAISKFLVKLGSSKKGDNPGWGYSATWSREGHNFNSADGFFDTGRENIPIGAEYAITVYADGFDPLTIDPIAIPPISDEPNRVEFRLKPPTILAGRVVDSNGLPIASARVRFLTDDKDFEHWDDRDTAVTNSKGKFDLAGIGSAERCIYITAESFAPYLGLSTDLPKNSEGAIEITLNRGAEVFGRVVDADGQGINGAKIGAHIFSEQMRQMLSSPYPNLSRQAHTDVDGYYELFDLPAGDFSVSVNTPLAQGNQNFAHKKVTLKQGQSLELNFGDEAGFRLTGVVRIGGELLEKANVQIRLPDNSTKWGHSNSEGRFRISGIPKGTYMVYTSYRPKLDSSTFQGGPGQHITDRRQVVVEDNIEMDIDLGDGIVSGKIPKQFVESDKLQITARRWAPKKPDDDIVLPRKWEYAGRAKINSDGKFSCPNLRAGRYYLLLSSDGETLGITDDFELGESEHIDNVTFNTGSGTLQINVIDADTSQGISETSFYIKNELEATFYSKKWVPEGNRYGMITDGNGQAKYSPLPDGSYVVWAQASGYLPSESEWVKVSKGKITPVTVSLEPAAVIRFELDSELQKQITAEYIYLRCRVSNAKTGDTVPILTFYGEHTEHMVWLAPEDNRQQSNLNLNLPGGQYQIEYRLYQDRKGSLSYKIRPALLEGIVNVEINKGETKLITVSE